MNRAAVKLNRIHKASYYIRERMLDVVDVVVGRIEKQGGGCSHPASGACYSYGGKRCAIGLLLKPDELKGIQYTTISSEANRKHLSKIISRFSLTTTVDSHRGFVVEFLQRIQDAHDNAYDTFNRVDDRDKKFADEIQNVRDWIATI
jgi:hypothetical protein